MRKTLSLRRKGILLVVIPLALSLAFLAALCVLNENIERQSSAENRARRIDNDVVWFATVPIHYMNAGGFWSERSVSRLNFNQTMYDQFVKESKPIVSELQALTEHHPQIHDSARAILDAFLHIMNMFDEERAAAMSGDLPPVWVRATARDRLQAACFAGMPIINKSAVRIQQITEAEIQKDRESQTQSRRLIARLVVGMLLLDVGACVALAVLFYKHTVRRLDELMRNTSSLVAGKPVAKSLSPGDEFAAIESSFRAMLAALEDIRKKEQAISDNLTAVVCEIDSDWKFKSLSKSSLANFGLMPQQLVDTRVGDLLSNPAALPVKSLNDAAPGAELSFSGRVQCGTSMKTFGFVVRCPLEPGALAHCVARDITAQTESEEFRDRALTLVTQKLKQPILAMDGVHKKLQAEQDLGANGQKLATMLARNSDRMLALMEDLTDAEAARTGTMSVVQVMNDVDQMCQQAIASVTSLAEKKRVSVTADLSPGLQCYCDGKRIVQVLVNLLGNAIKFSPENSAIRIFVESADSAVRWRVVDEGRGIPTEIQQKLFTQFQQVESADARVHGGSGVGLSICKQIVELHQGQIGVNSEPGKGSTFWFSLPRGGSTY